MASPLPNLAILSDDRLATFHWRLSLMIHILQDAIATRELSESEQNFLVAELDAWEWALVKVISEQAQRVTIRSREIADEEIPF